MIPSGVGLLLWVCFIHLVAIYLFTSGFLLTRLSLPNTAIPTAESFSASTHQRAVFLIIDALRFDFLTPAPPKPPSEFHHNVLTLPRELTAAHPRNSFLFNTYVDPPTTTLQRIKGLTTGSLPTFVDLGHSFGGSAIEEDSLLQQLRHAGKKVAFMGDDTWMSVFSALLQPNMSFPYDSFNVEDLHSVDTGVITHLFPLLQDPTRPFDFLIGHFLGVDHVGHRVGPDHPNMRAKLKQMNDVLTRVVELLDDDTLLVVLGDHGMDRAGDHGGDGVLETSAALWIYSKTRPIAYTPQPIPTALLPQVTFPGTSTSHRTVQQIDILPSIALLLGLPIPFNNLGSVIPELFWRDSKGLELKRALELNAAQINAYLSTYRASSSGGELDDAWANLQNLWAATQAVKHSPSEHLVALYSYNRSALETCRSLWAQFNPILMVLGLILMVVGLVATWSAFTGLGESDDSWDAWLGSLLTRCIRGVAGGSVVGFLAYIPLKAHIPGVSPLDLVLFTAALLSSIIIILYARPALSLGFLSSFSLPLILHSLAFLSNSFTFWEDRIVPFLLVSSIVPSFIKGITAPTSRLRKRITGFTLLFAACVRLISFSTVCREEQQPYCHVTFYSFSSLQPTVAVFLAAPVSILLPWIIQRFLSISRSDNGLAKTFLPWILTPTLLVGTIHWMLEWADSVGIYGDKWAGVSRSARTMIAWLAFGGALGAGLTLWWLVPLCLDVRVEKIEGEEGEKNRVEVIGFANAYGSPYLIFWTIFLAFVYTTSQLPGQIVLALTTIALVAHLEVVDSVRDVRSLDTAFASANPSTALEYDARPPPPVRLAELVPVALLGLHAFFGTGHQAALPSMQWKSAFVLAPTVSYPLAPLTVLLNTLGGVLLAGLAAPLPALWNRAPPAHAAREAARGALGVMGYFATLLLGAAGGAGALRRHLMVWKVFAPRYMLAAVAVVAVDVAALIGVGIGVARIAHRVEALLGPPKKS